MIFGKISPKIIFFETLEKERGDERSQDFLRRFMRFRRSEVIEPRVKVLRRNEGYA